MASVKTSNGLKHHVVNENGEGKEAGIYEVRLACQAGLL